MDFDSAKSFIIRELDQLSPALTYHGKHHTLDVLSVAEIICKAEKMADYETALVRTAALLHDIGFLRHYRDHEVHSCHFAEEILPQFNYTDWEIARICGMIRATKIPQTPKNHLEEILCDADLDYLGRADFEQIAQTLFEEMKTMHLITTKDEWNTVQIIFLENHEYFTKTNEQKRSLEKAKRLAELRRQVAEMV